MKLALRCLVFLVVLMLCPLNAFSMGDKDALRPAGPSAQLNQQAPSFSLETLDGKKVSLEEQRGKVVLVNFWASWCPPCDMEIPSLSALAAMYKDKGLVILAINVEKISPEKLTRWLSRRPHKFSTLLDPTRKTQFAYGVRALPETFLVDQKGIVVKRYIGARDWVAPDVTKTIDFLLGG